MITNVLLDHPWLPTVALVVLIITGPLIGGWLVPRVRLAWGLAALSLLPVVLLTLIPVDRVLYEQCTVQWVLPTQGRVELMANVVLFIAPVLLAGVASRRPVQALAAGIGLSALLEATQALVPAIGRSCDTTDWMSNTIGAVVGALLALAALRVARTSSTNGAATPS